MHYNQLLLTKFGKNFVIVTDDVKITSKVQTDDMCYFEYIWRPEQPLIALTRIDRKLCYVSGDRFMFSTQQQGSMFLTSFTEANPALCVFIDNGNSSSRKQFRPLGFSLGF